MQVESNKEEEAGKKEEHDPELKEEGEESDGVDATTDILTSITGEESGALM